MIEITLKIDDIDYEKTASALSGKLPEGGGGTAALSGAARAALTLMSERMKEQLALRLLEANKETIIGSLESLAGDNGIVAKVHSLEFRAAR